MAMICSRMLAAACAFLAYGGVVSAADDRGSLTTRPSEEKLAAVADVERGVCVDCRIETIAQGEFSGYRYGDERFLGLRTVVRDPDSWTLLWRRHTEGLSDPPPVPPIDFRRVHVLAVMQGTMPASCGPAITITGVHRCHRRAVVTVLDDQSPGLCPAISNPFHFVKVPIRCLGVLTSVAFVSNAPGDPAFGAVMGNVAGPGLDGALRPIGGAWVRLVGSRNDDPNTTPQILAETRTADDGAYVLAEIPPGRYLVAVSAEGYVRAEARVVVFPGERSEQDFILRPEQEPAGGVAGVVRGGPSWERSVPLPGSHVMLYAPADPDAPSVTDLDLVEQIRTDCAGRFHFFGLDPGRYVLKVEAANFAPTRALVEVVEGQLTARRFLLEPL
jgi:hypothetical protein